MEMKSIALFQGDFSQKQSFRKTSIKNCRYITCNTLQCAVCQVVTIYNSMDKHLSRWTKGLFMSSIGRFYGRPWRPSASIKCPRMDKFLSKKSTLLSRIVAFCPPGQKYVHDLCSCLSTCYKTKNAINAVFFRWTMPVLVNIKNHRIILR